MDNIKTLLLNKRLHLLIACIFFLLSLFGYLAHGIQQLGLNQLQRLSLEQIASSTSLAEKRFLLLSTSKSALTIIESSSVGVSLIVDANVQIGNAITTIKHLIDKAWDASLLGLSQWFILAMLVSAGKSLLPLVLTVVSALLVIVTALNAIPWVDLTQTNLLSRLYLAAKRTAKISLLLGVTFIYVLPSSLACSAYLISEVTSDTHQTIDSGLEQHNLYYSSLSKNTQIDESAKQFFKILEKDRKKMDSDLKELHAYIYKHVALLVLEILIMPVTIFVLITLLLYVMLKRND